MVTYVSEIFVSFVVSASFDNDCMQAQMFVFLSLRNNSSMHREIEDARKILNETDYQILAMIY